MVNKILLTLQFLMVIVLSSCQGDDPIYTPTDEPMGTAEHTVFVYMPWSGDPGSLKNAFETNLRDMKSAVKKQGGLGNTRFMVYISQNAREGLLINVKYRGGECVDDTLGRYDNLLAGQRLNTVPWISSILRKVQEYAPAKTYSMIIGCHGMGWIPSNERRSRSVRLMSLGQQSFDYEPLTRWFGGNTYPTDIATLNDGIAQSGIGKMEYVLFDDCYMSTVEVAFEMRYSAKHIIGCPTEIMAYGMPYAQMFDELLKTEPNYERVCDEFYDFYSNYPYPYGTISVIDCSQVEGMVNLMREINTSDEVATADVSTLQVMDGYLTSIFFDMGDYVRQIARNRPDLIERFEKQLSLLVPYKRHTESYFSDVRSPGRGIVLPIHDYSGIDISDPSQNQSIIDAFDSSPYYQASH